MYVSWHPKKSNIHIKSGMLAVSSCHFATAYRDSKASHGKTMSADDHQPVLAKTRASSNCELREFPEIVQSKGEKK